MALFADRRTPDASLDDAQASAADFFPAARRSSNFHRSFIAP